MILLPQNMNQLIWEIWKLRITNALKSNMLPPVVICNPTRAIVMILPVKLIMDNQSLEVLIIELLLTSNGLSNCCSHPLPFNKLNNCISTNYLESNTQKLIHISLLFCMKYAASKWMTLINNLKSKRMILFKNAEKILILYPKTKAKLMMRKESQQIPQPIQQI